MEAEGWSSSGTMRIDMVNKVVHQLPPVAIGKESQVRNERTPGRPRFPRQGSPNETICSGRACRLRKCAILLGTQWGRKRSLYVPATETPPNLVRITGSTFSLRVLAAAIILLFCYYAQGVVITLLLSILLAYFLDPAVELLERIHVPRTVGAMTMVLILIAVLVAGGYGLGERTADFAANWPKYSGMLRQAASTVESKINGPERHPSGIGQDAGKVRADFRPEPGVVRTLIVR